MKKETGTDELVDIIFEAIDSQPYFNSGALKPKIKAIIVAFRLRMASKNYNKILNPSQTSKMIRANEIKNMECEFWKKALKNIVGDGIEKYYSQLDKERELWDSQPPQS